MSVLPAGASDRNIDEDEGDGIYLSELFKGKAKDADNGGFSLFHHSTSAELFQEGLELKNEGKLRRASKKFKAAIKRAPNSELAPMALQYTADIYMQRGKYSKARMTYEDLLSNYGAQADYKAVFDALMVLAQKQTAQRHLTWMFGGYTSPENAIPTLELVVRYGPASALAPASQYRIGRTYQKNEDFYEAVAAYDVVLFRYPDSTVIERAALAKADCLRQISKNQHNNETARADAWQACKVFLSMFPESEDKEKVSQWGVDLYLARAQDVYNKAAFYETIAFKPEAAQIYYRIVAEDFSESALAEKAAEKIESLQQEEPTDA